MCGSILRFSEEIQDAIHLTHVTFKWENKVFFVKKPLIVNEMVRFAASYSQVQRRLLKELAIPYAVMDRSGTILWANDEFMDLAELSPRQKKIKNII